MSSGDERIRFARLISPPGIHRARQQKYRVRYARERTASITSDADVSWPIDLGGESGA